MLKINKYIILLSALTLMIGCEADNFEMPSGKLEGKIIYYDEETGEEMPYYALGGSDYALVRMYEVNENFPSATAEYIPVYGNGTFVQSMLPETSYKIDTYMSPHVLVSPETVAIKAGETSTVTLECIPYLVISLWDKGNNTLGLKITKPAALNEEDYPELTGNLERIYVCFGDHASVNSDYCNSEIGTRFTYTFTGGNTQANALGLEAELSMEKFVNNIDGALAITDGYHYFRVSARITGCGIDELNHSNTVYAKFDSSLVSQ